MDTAGRVISNSYGERVAMHEAGHFLCAYLVGLLPRRYTLSSLDAFKRCPFALRDAFSRAEASRHQHLLPENRP